MQLLVLHCACHVDSALRALIVTGIPAPRAESKPDTPRIKEVVIPKTLLGRLVSNGGAGLKRIMVATDAIIELSGMCDAVFLKLQITV